MENFSNRNLGVLPQEEVRTLIAQLQALAPEQGPAPGV